MKTDGLRIALLCFSILAGTARAEGFLDGTQAPMEQTKASPTSAATIAPTSQGRPQAAPSSLLREVQAAIQKSEQGLGEAKGFFEQDSIPRSIDDLASERWWAHQNHQQAKAMAAKAQAEAERLERAATEALLGPGNANRVSGTFRGWFGRIEKQALESRVSRAKAIADAQSKVDAAYAVFLSASSPSGKLSAAQTFMQAQQHLARVSKPDRVELVYQENLENAAKKIGGEVLDATKQAAQLRNAVEDLQVQIYGKGQGTKFKPGWSQYLLQYNLKIDGNSYRPY